MRDGLALLAKEQQRSLIFWSKNCRKELAKVDGEIEFGSAGVLLRERSESSVDHNFFGCLEH